MANDNSKKKVVKSKASADKVKLVRDSYTIPKDEFSLIAEIKQKCLKKGVDVKKSEVLRAGLLALVNMNTSDLLKAIAKVERIKTGRPKKD